MAIYSGYVRETFNGDVHSYLGIKPELFIELQEYLCIRGLGG